MFYYAFYLGSPNVYIGQETFLPSGFGFPVRKGSPLKKHVDKWWNKIGSIFK